MLESSPQTTTVHNLPYFLWQRCVFYIWLWMIFIMSVTVCRLFMISIWPWFVNKHLPAVFCVCVHILPYMYFTAWVCANVQAERVQRLKAHTALVLFDADLENLKLLLLSWMNSTLSNIKRSFRHNDFSKRFNGRASMFPFEIIWQFCKKLIGGEVPGFLFDRLLWVRLINMQRVEML